MSIHENYILCITDESFIIQPVPNALEETLIIDRSTNETKLSNKNVILPDTEKIYFSGLVGAIQLVSEICLVIITKKENVGQLMGNDIWQLKEVKILPYKEEELNENEKKFNSSCKEMIEKALRTQYFYFSYTYDLTHSLQQLQSTNPEFLLSSIYERANLRYVWNNFMINNFNPKSELKNFLLPIIHGYFSISTININEKTVDLALISRRSIHNAGTRFNVRGTDNEGNVANFVETEQIILNEDYRCSYIQIRGSIPIYWSQKPNLKYKPSMVVNETRNHIEAFQKHIESIHKYYENQVMINLVNQHGSEGKLEKVFFDTFKSINNPSLRYEAFDFHKQCGNDRWDRLSILINRLANDQDSFGYFFVNKNGNVLGMQKGVFRTNCVDCLDRTNVVQSLLAKRILHVQLIRMNVISENLSIESNVELYEAFRRMWADNGDLLSIQYAGTGALKSDFTRTGQRTTYGMLKDGVNSLHRYYINNFSDGYRQDSIDLFLGNYKVTSEEVKLIEQSKLDANNRKYLAIPVIGFATFSMFIISLITPAATYQEQMTYVLFWGFATMCCLAVMVYFGQEFVDSPVLIKNKNKKEQ